MFYLFAVLLKPLGGEGLANGSLDCSNWGELRATTGDEVSIDNKIFYTFVLHKIKKSLLVLN